MDSRNQNYDTNSRNCDTPLRLYKVGHTFYYRRRIKQKLCRISLRTKNIKTALKRRKVLDLIGEEMFQLETKDIKLVFEYDTEEELRTALEQVKQLQIETTIAKYKATKEHIETAENRELKTFENLRDLYILKLERDGNCEPSEYLPTFKKLIAFFQEKDIYTLTVKDMEDFKLHLKNGLTKATVNKHLIYLKRALNYVDINVVDKVALFSKRQVEAEREKFDNYTDAEIRTILDYDYKEENAKKAIKIALYTGMRQGEIRKIEPQDIKQDPTTNIYYIDIPKAKSEAGERQVPIHPDILDLVLNTEFPLSDDIENKNQFSKFIRSRLYQAVNVRGKTFHTLRANTMSKLIDCTQDSANPYALNIIQEIVGHAHGDKVKLTVTTYKGGFSIEQKYNILCNLRFE
ncbi:hypothetical protein [Sulfurimonas sp.]|uniref:hypothetical protein n=1 Tax=Sulfurimonas sp. TaxID=2022749 RepID=UPI003D13A049